MMVGMTIPARLTVVTLGARDLPALRSFYRSLGWPEVAGSDDTWAGFLLGGVLLALFGLDDLTAEAAPEAAGRTAPGGDRSGGDRSGSDWSGVTLACSVDTAEEVDTAFADAVAAGARVVAEPIDREWGGRSGYVADPEGNRWEIAWAPSAVLDPRGALTAFGA
jgi:catechol 2,3-dioxygenase-like lactoylglutathione lyase family enzyme